MLSKLESAYIFAQEFNTPIRSLAFLHKAAGGFLCVYNHYNNQYTLKLEENNHSLAHKIFCAFDCDPQGCLLWVPKKYVSKFIKFISKFLVQMDKLNLLTINNNGLSETFLLHHLKKGMLVEMVSHQPSKILFENLIEQFKVQCNIEKSENFENPDEEIFYFFHPHLSTHFDHVYSKEQKKLMKFLMFVGFYME